MVPNGVYCNISFTFVRHGRTIAFSAYCIGHRDVDERQRGKMEGLRPMVQAVYEQARLRSLLALGPLARLMSAIQ
jgi:hypothetical protein